MLDQFSTVLLDMNDTFMFGADKFGSDKDYSVIYHQLGGLMEQSRVNKLIQAAYNYLDIRYPDPQYREAFPSLREAFLSTEDDGSLSEKDLEHLIETFALHELGFVPPEYAASIERLSQKFRIGLVIDIWAPKALWIETLNQCGVLPLCEATSFSSDCGMVKPSPRPFLKVLEEMQVNPQDAVVIGDSVRRDLGGATAAGISCILVGGARHPSALESVASLIDVVNSIAIDSHIEKLTDLPQDLPIPVDDGACDRLQGESLPSIALSSTQGEYVDLSVIAGLVVIYCYPMTGQPGVPLPNGWEQIPGARGCTPQSCAFRDLHQELSEIGAQVFGLSTQSTEYQVEASNRLHLPFELLSDRDLGFAKALKLPMFEIDGKQLIKRITLIANAGKIVKVFYPVFPPDENANEVIHWLKIAQSNEVLEVKEAQ
jgi:peroxiredoxin/FMN phosphatase YigB (HAD superfamily)